MSALLDLGSDLSHDDAFEIVPDQPFFAPASSDLVTGLMGRYRLARQQIAQMAGLVAGDLGNVIQYFIDGNGSENRALSSMVAAHLFDEAGAIKALDAKFWSEALSLTDVLDHMPQARRTQWHRQLTAWKDSRYVPGAKPEEDLPEFEEGVVRDTLTALLNMRQQFLAERVDGLFRGLSGEHVTNVPEGFGKRMIIAYVLDSFGYVNHDRAGLINDLRCVIAKFMGRDEPRHYVSSHLVEKLKQRWGEWVTVDGGSLRVRLYKKGTAHLEVHPDMAWRLNATLAHLHPMAIPAAFRQRPAKRCKEFRMIDRPLPFSVLELLTERQSGYGHDPKSFSLSYCAKNQRAAYDEAVRVLTSIGGTVDAGGLKFQFDYCPYEVISEIVTSGCVPDQHSHQFYPTPENVAEAAVAMAEIGPDDRVLEPSAGHGDLAAHLPKHQTTCVEISPLRCSVLKARGFNVQQGDFLDWVKTAPMFQRAVMNPPFSEGRWKAHLEAAATRVAPGGRLVAIVPASARGKDLLDGFDSTWSRVYADEFAGTSVSVAIVCAVRRVA